MIFSVSSYDLLVQLRETIWQNPVETNMPVSCDQSTPFLVRIVENNSKLYSRRKTCQQMPTASLLPCETENALIYA